MYWNNRSVSDGVRGVHKCDSETSPHLLLYRSRGRSISWSALGPPDGVTIYTKPFSAFDFVYKLKTACDVQAVFVDYSVRSTTGI